MKLKKGIKQILKVILFIAIGVGLFIFVYKNIDTQETIKSLKNANYNWIILSVILGLVSHISRAMRWNLLIKPMGYKPKTLNSFFSVMIMYISNIAVPRSGEFVRCSVMSRYEKIPFPKLFGTVITERVFDFIMLFLMLIAVLLYSLRDIKKVVSNNPGVYEKLAKINQPHYLIIITVTLIALAILMYVFRHQIKKSIIARKIKKFLQDMFEGIKTVYYMQEKLKFIFHTVLIWVLYFVMIYVTFFAFEFTSHLTVMQALVIFVLASFGMVFPSPGGIGSWHFMVIQGLFLYGVSEPEKAGAFAFAAHGSMTLMLIVVGAISFILMPIMNKNHISES